MKIKKRQDNERKFNEWIETDNGERIYKLKILGKFGWQLHLKKLLIKKKTL